MKMIKYLCYFGYFIGVVIIVITVVMNVEYLHNSREHSNFVSQVGDDYAYNYEGPLKEKEYMLWDKTYNSMMNIRSFTILISPLLLYMAFLFSKKRRWLSYVMALVIDWVCFLSSGFIYCCSTDFEMINDGESIMVTQLMIFIKIIICLIFAGIYVFLYYRKKRKSS